MNLPNAPTPPTPEQRERLKQLKNAEPLPGDSLEITLAYEEWLWVRALLVHYVTNEEKKVLDFVGETKGISTNRQTQVLSPRGLEHARSTRDLLDQAIFNAKLRKAGIA